MVIVIEVPIEVGIVGTDELLAIFLEKPAGLDFGEGDWFCAHLSGNNIRRHQKIDLVLKFNVRLFVSDLQN